MTRTSLVLIAKHDLKQSAGRLEGLQQAPLQQSTCCRGAGVLQNIIKIGKIHPDTFYFQSERDVLNRKQKY